MIVIPKEHQQAFTPSFHGAYFVVYPNGLSSWLMQYKTARRYSQMFGGVVYFRITDYCATVVTPRWMDILESALWSVLFWLLALAAFSC